MLPFPVIPEVPPSQRASGTFSLRYEDVAQDGRVLLEALSPALGATVWRKMRSDPDAEANMARGVVPILTHLVGTGTPGPFSIHHDFQAEGLYQMAHSVGADGSVDKLLVNMWVDVSAPIGSTHGPPPEHAGEVRLAGRIYAQHVITRLFAPPAERKVTRLENTSGRPEVPETRGRWVSPAEVMRLPEGATLLEPQLRVDDVRVAFGVDHTDSNQHVNSMVYPRLFSEAALRRLAALGKRTDVLARHVEVGYRKPSFAGEQVAIALQAFELDGKLGAVGMYLATADAESPDRIAAARPLCTVRVIFEP
jgi:acyl-CoA thioesterase FadM